MKINIETISSDVEEEIVIRCHELNDEVIEIMNKLKTVKDNSLICFKDDKIFKVDYSDIYYIESVENKTFVYLEKNVYETKLKLYEIEEALRGTKCFRASKSTIVNAKKIKYVIPSFSSRFDCLLMNNERMVISRQYVPVLKEILGL